MEKKWFQFLKEMFCAKFLSKLLGGRFLWKKTVTSLLLSLWHLRQFHLNGGVAFETKFRENYNDFPFSEFR